MELIQWHKVYKLGEDEVNRLPVVALNLFKCIKFYQTGKIGVGPHKNFKKYENYCKKPLIDVCFFFVCFFFFKNFKKVGAFDVEWPFDDMNEECNMPGTVKNLF